jgi:short-subunit dehydrogenase involved in D-alanine esterification of teichoic acids
MATPKGPLDIGEIIPVVTGGGSGIGFGLVEEFLKLGSPKVI